MLRRALLLACLLLPWHRAHAAPWGAGRAVGYVPLRVGSLWGVRPSSLQEFSLWYRLSPSRPPDLGLLYRNARLTPFEVGVLATVQHDPSERRAVVCLKRAWGPFSGAISLEGLESERELMLLGMGAPTAMSPRWARRFGPRVTLGTVVGLQDVDGDLLHGVRLGLGGRAWPASLGNRGSGLDTRGHVEMAVPLPGHGRHRLLMAGRFRQLWDAEAPLLRTGGTFDGWQAGQRHGGAMGAALSEGLRGYEDRSWYTRGLTTVELSQRVPVTPTMDVEWFVIGARTDGDDTAHTEVPAVHRVAGSALRVHSAVGGAPVIVSYQTAYRWDVREPWLHLVTATLL